VTEETGPIAVAYERPSQDSLTKYDLGVLAVRLLGLYVLFYSLIYATLIPSYFMYPMPGGPQNWVVLMTSAVPCVIFAAVGTFLLRQTAWVVRRAFPEFVAAATLSASGRDLQAVLFSAIGVWLVGSTVPELARFAAQYWLTGRLAPSGSSIDAVPGMAATVVQIVMGAFLFTRAKGLSALWHRLRYAGVPHPPA
jgi:hypothetical protein